MVRVGHGVPGLEIRDTVSHSNRKGDNCKMTKEKKKREGLLERIKKLFAMGNDTRGNENESQTALLKAQKLMAEHGISQTEINDENSIDNTVQDVSITGYKSIEWWHGRLGVIISENFKCFCYVDNRRQGYRNLLKSINFVGLSDDIKIAREVFYYAIMMIEYHVEVYVRNYRIENPGKTSYKPIENRFIEGYLSGLKRKFEEQKEQNKSEWGLVLVRDKRIDEYTKNELNLKKSNSKIRSSNDMEHYDKGFKKGKAFNMINGHLET